MGLLGARPGQDPHKTRTARQPRGKFTRTPERSTSIGDRARAAVPLIVNDSNPGPLINSEAGEPRTATHDDLSVRDSEGW